MIRYRWYKLGLPISLMQLIYRLSVNKYSPSKPSGFIVLDETSKSFRFAWQSNLLKTSFDANGVRTVELISTVNFCDFSLIENLGCFWVRIVDPPRSSRDLMNALEENCGFGFYVEPVTFSQSVLPPSLTKIDGVSLIGFKAIASISTQHAVARIEVASKSGLIVKELTFLSGMQYTIDHSTYDIIFQRVHGQVAFSSNGLLKISGQLAPLILDLVQRDLVFEPR